MLKLGARFAATSAMYSGAEVSARTVQFACLFGLAGVCSKEQYGALGLVFATQQLFTMLVLAGLTEVMTGRSSEARKAGHLGTLFAKSRGLLSKKIAVLLLVAIFVAMFAGSIGSQQVSPLAVFAACLSGMLLARFRLTAVMYQLEQKHWSAIQFQSVPLLICYTSGFACALAWSNPVDGLFVGGSAGLLAWSIVTRRRAVPVETAAEDDPLLERAIFRDSLSFAAIAFLSWFSGYGNSVLIRGFFDMKTIAEYTMVCHFDGMIFILLTSIAKVWLPQFYKMAVDKPPEATDAANSLAFQVQALVVAIAGGCLLILYPLIPTLLKGKFEGYSHLVPYIALVYSSHIILNGYYRSHAYFLLHREGSVFFRLLLLASLAGFGAWMAVMYFAGPIGIYLGVLIMAALRSASMYLYARQRWVLTGWLADSASALAILGLAYGLTTTSLPMWCQAIGFIATTSLVVSYLYLGPISAKMQSLRPSLPVGPQVRRPDTASSTSV